MLTDDEKTRMDENQRSEVTLAPSWEGRMRQIASCELPYNQALQIALECVEVSERYSAPQPQSMSPAVPDAKLDIVVNLSSGSECDVRLAVYSLYHDNKLVQQHEAIEKLLSCGRRSDSPS